MMAYRVETCLKSLNTCRLILVPGWCEFTTIITRHHQSVLKRIVGQTTKTGLLDKIRLATVRKSAVILFGAVRRIDIENHSGGWLVQPLLPGNHITPSGLFHNVVVFGVQSFKLQAHIVSDNRQIAVGQVRAGQWIIFLHIVATFFHHFSSNYIRIMVLGVCSPPMSSNPDSTRIMAQQAHSRRHQPNVNWIL